MTLVWGLSTVAAAQGRPDAIERLLARAAQLEERGRGAAAERLRLRALERAAPDDGRPALALAAALPTDPRSPRTLSSEAREAAGRIADALDAFASEAPRHERRAEADRLRAWARALAGELERAVEQASGAAGLQDRASAELLRRLATSAALEDRLAIAQRALEAAHRAWPQDNAILSELGAVALARGAPTVAIEHFQRVLGRRPTDLAARRDLAGALVAAGRADGAAALLSRAVAAHPEDLNLRLELAHAALEAGDAALAERAARAAAERLPGDDARAHAVLGSALAAARRPAEARAAFREALRRDDRDLRARQGLAALDGAEPPSPPLAPSPARALDAP